MQPKEKYTLAKGSFPLKINNPHRVLKKTKALAIRSKEHHHFIFVKKLYIITLQVDMYKRECS